MENARRSLATAPGGSTFCDDSDIALSPYAFGSKAEIAQNLTPLGQLPHSNRIIGFLRNAAGLPGALMPLAPLKGSSQLSQFRQNVLAELLEAHPAFAQLLAQNPELRSVIESGVEAILEPMNSAGSVSDSRVLWTVCTAVWQGISLVVGGLCGKLPASAAPLEGQIKHLHQVNDGLREQLSKCRRDYLRELTELRERCRQLDAPVEVALVSLLNEEPVMFFEPFNFVFDELTKEFINYTVEEKLRLLMLKGWRKVNDEELVGLQERIQELQAENEELHDLRASLDEIRATYPMFCSEPEVDVDGPRSLKVLEALQLRLKEFETETRALRAEAASTAAEIQALHRRLEELEESDSESSSAHTPSAQLCRDEACEEDLARLDAELAAANLEVASQRQHIHELETELAAALAKADAKQDDISATVEAVSLDQACQAELPCPSAAVQRHHERQPQHQVQQQQKELQLQKQPQQQVQQQRCYTSSTLTLRNSTSDKDVSGYVELQRLHATLERQHKELKRKLGRLTERLREDMDVRGYDIEVLNDALAYAGLDTPKTPAKKVGHDRVQATCERLYADAKRRISRMRARTSQVHAMQRAELEKCCFLARDQAIEQKVKHLKGLHQNSVTSANALHDALESFHSDIMRTTIEEGNEEAEISEPDNNAANPAHATYRSLLGSPQSIGYRSLLGSPQNLGDSKPKAERHQRPKVAAEIQEIERIANTRRGIDIDKSLEHTLPLDACKKQSALAAHASTPDSLLQLPASADAGSCSPSKPPRPELPEGAMKRRVSMPALPSAHEKRPNIQHTPLFSRQSIDQPVGWRQKPCDLAQNQLEALRDIFSKASPLGPSAAKVWSPIRSDTESNASSARATPIGSKKRSGDSFKRHHMRQPQTASKPELAQAGVRRLSKSMSLTDFCALPHAPGNGSPFHNSSSPFHGA